MKIDPTLSAAKMLLSDSSFSQYKFYVDSQRFPGEGATNDSGEIENVDFQCSRALNLRNLRKQGQRYYILVLFSPLPPFHWPLNM